MFHIITVLFSSNYVVFIGNGSHILDRSLGQAVKHTKLKTGTNCRSNKWIIQKRNSGNSRLRFA